MIKLERTSVMNFDNALHGMRNPLNSWGKNDSHTDENGVFIVGPNDMKLAKSLINGGSDDRKFLRMIHVCTDITAPAYWAAELDTYKIATTRNSCSLQHKGASRPYTIRDFSVRDEIYEILDPVKTQMEHPIVYPECGENDYLIYNCGERQYKVFRNGKVVACAYSCPHEEDTRIRHFQERVLHPSRSPFGYLYLNLGGKRFHERWQLHRLVATVWLGDHPGMEVNHKDGNKGNNAAENLEWVTHQDNDRHKHETGLSGRTLHTDYIAWRNAMKIDPNIRNFVLEDHADGVSYKDIMSTYNISQPRVSEILRHAFCENDWLFTSAFQWENTIREINDLRELYLDTQDYTYFEDMRRKIPMSYNYTFTWDANYENLLNIYHARKNHRLPEWHTFCDWILTLPYTREWFLKEEK